MLTAADGPLLAALACVVRHGSFTAAAVELKLSKSAVSARVRQLEERAGVTLLERTTRKVRLTEAGAEVLDAVHRVEDALSRVSRELEEARREPTGLLRVSTTNDLGPLLVGPAAARFVAAHPRVRVEVLAEDAQRDLIDARIDLAVRLGAPKSSSFVARRLAVLEEPIVAAPQVAERLGKVERPRDLAGAPWVRHSLLGSQSMRFSGPDGAHEELNPTVRAEANTGPTILSLLLHGAGVGVLPEHALHEHLRAGRLVRLCAPWIWKSVELYALTPSRANPRSATGLFIAMLREEVARAKWSEPG